MNTHTATTAPRPNIFDTFENDERWLGFGYIGGRRNALTPSTDPEVATTDPKVVEAADAAILAHAAHAGWTTDQLFDWANSKLGRWFADAALSGDLERACSPRWNLLTTVDA